MKHPLDLKVVGERVRVIGSRDGHKNAPMQLEGVAAEVLRPSAIEGFVFVWLEGKQCARQVHASCLHEEADAELMQGEPPSEIERD
jgi:hypothetical protein